MTDTVFGKHLDPDFVVVDDKTECRHAHRIGPNETRTPLDTAIIVTATLERSGNELGLITEGVELDDRIDSRRTGKHGPHEPRLEFAELVHDVHRDSSELG